MDQSPIADPYGGAEIGAAGGESLLSSQSAIESLILGRLGRGTPSEEFLWYSR